MKTIIESDQNRGSYAAFFRDFVSRSKPGYQSIKVDNRVANSLSRLAPFRDCLSNADSRRSDNALEGCQLFNAVDNRLRDIPGSARVVLPDALYSGFKLVGRFGGPPNLPHE